MAFNPKNHDAFEADALDWLEGQGFLCDKATYHEKMARQMIELLQSRYSLTSLYVRTRADRIAAHRELPIEFEWEAKTENKYPNIAVEMIPLAHHISKSKLGVRCLYICRMTAPAKQENGPSPSQALPKKSIREFGFWANKNILPLVNAVFVPDRWDGPEYENFRLIARTRFPNADQMHGFAVNGSGDPYVLINEHNLVDLRDWRTMVLDWIAIERERLSLSLTKSS